MSFVRASLRAAAAARHCSAATTAQVAMRPRAAARPALVAARWMSGEGGTVEQRVVAAISQFQGVQAEKVTMEANFIKDLGLDSLDAVELVMSLEDEFDIQIPDAEQDTIVNAKTAVEVVKAKLQ